LNTAIISDLHSNYASLEAWIKDFACNNYDEVVILGDLLTYGPSPREVIEAVAKLVGEHNTQIILGNHDQLYLDIENGNLDYYNNLPDWIKQSADWTYEELNKSNHFEVFKSFPWEESYSKENIYFAHANPFGYGDWTYLNNPSQIQRVLTELKKQNYQIGVFGHNHRVAYYPNSNRNHFLNKSRFTADCNNLDQIYLNPGSLGQPRSKEKKTTFLTIKKEDNKFEIEKHIVEYNRSDYISKVNGIDYFSNETKKNIVNYIA